jgi:hypothetical protein
MEGYPGKLVDRIRGVLPDDSSQSLRISARDQCFSIKDDSGSNYADYFFFIRYPLFTGTFSLALSGEFSFINWCSLLYVLQTLKVYQLNRAIFPAKPAR